MASYETILSEKKDRVSIITFNRPNVLNAWNEKLVSELDEAVTSAGQDPEVRVLLITGSGRAYNAGGDIKEFQNATPDWMERFNSRVIKIFRYLENLKKPVVVAVNGLANIESFQFADLVIASEEARFGLPEINIGVCPGAGITIRLPHLVGPLKAKELLFSGEWIEAQEALKMGLVNRIVPGEKLMDEATDLARKLASKAPLALGAIKSCVNVGSSMDLDSGMKFQLLEHLKLFHTQDLKEGLQAFLEKRQPKYQGR